MFNFKGRITPPRKQLETLDRTALIMMAADRNLSPEALRTIRAILIDRQQRGDKR